jgi:DMSO/TMAO reductase YedYZ molybdopterin-dependent catalytic subunit
MLRRRVTLIVLVLMLALTFSACREKPDWEIVFGSSGAEELVLSNLDLEEIEQVEITATKLRKDGSEEEQHWRGITLKAALEYLGISEYEGVVAESADGYTVQLDKATVDDDGTLLGMELNGNELEEGDGPVQLVVSSARSNMWVKQLSKITVEK